MPAQGPAGRAPEIRVFLAEDHRAVRDGLRLLLELEGDVRVVGEAEDGYDVVESASALRPDVVLMDVRLVGLDGIEATRRLQVTAPSIAVVMLSASLEADIVRAALDAGARGYLHKRATGDELRAAVRAAAAGRPWIAEALREVLRLSDEGAPARRSAADDPLNTLSPREVQVLQLIAEGLTNREIAERLALSTKTVETHRTHLMEKLDLHEVASLTRYALRKGLVG